MRLYSFNLQGILVISCFSYSSHICATFIVLRFRFPLSTVIDISPKEVLNTDLDLLR